MFLSVETLYGRVIVLSVFSPRNTMRYLSPPTAQFQVEAAYRPQNVTVKLIAAVGNRGY